MKIALAEDKPSSPLWLALILCAVLAASPLEADPPSISNLSPRGAQRGQAVTLVVEGANLDSNPELIFDLPAPRRLFTAEPYKPAPNRVAFEFQVNETDAPGPYPLRLRTDDGISNPVLFLVGLFPEAVEDEPNDLPENARPIEYPLTINGTLGPADRDTFKFTAKKGQWICFEVEARRIGSGVDPTLHLLAPSGREIAMQDDARGLQVDCRIDHTFSADGEYLVQVHDAMYLGQTPGFYRLKVGPVAYADGVFPLGGRRGSEVLITFQGGRLPQAAVDRIRLDAPSPESLLTVGLPPALDTAGSLPFPLRIGELPEILETPRTKPEDPQPFSAPVTINGRLDQPGELDRYAFRVKAGEKWVFEVEAHTLGSFLDGVLQVTRADGVRLAIADDTGPNPDPRLEFVVPEGLDQVIVALLDLHRRGGPGFAYRLTVRENRPDFLLNLVTTTLNLPLKGTGLVEVDVTRRGYNGPIRLQVVDPPPGFAVRGGLVAAGQPKGFLSISAPPEGKLKALDLVIRGTGEVDVPLALAQGSIFLAADRGMPVSPLRSFGVAAAVARSLPIAIRAEEGPVRVALGQVRQVKVQALRGGEGGESALKLQGVFLPPGITAADGTLAENAGEGTLTFTAAPNAGLVEGDAAVRAIANLKGKGVAIVAPIFTVAVVPPFVLELVQSAVEGPLGGGTELQGQVRREPPFAGEVELKVDGLPPGVTAPAVVVSGAQTEFKFALTAADPQKPGKLDLKLAASTKLGDPKSPTMYNAPSLPFTYTLKPAGTAQ